MESIYDLLAPWATAAGVSLAWIKSTALNVLFGTGALKQTFKIRGRWNLCTAGVICLISAFVTYSAAPMTAFVGAALVFSVTALTLEGLKKGRELLPNKMSPRG